MDLGISQLFPVTENSQIGEARRRAEKLARQIGFNEVETGNIAIAITELGTNLIKHTANGGALIIQALRDGETYAVEVIATNAGGGSIATDAWMQDGYSTTNTLGTGLGAVKRLSDSFDLFSGSDLGTTVSARFKRKTKVKPRFDVAAVCRPKPGEEACGDNWSSKQQGNRSMILLADGLGHGPDAALASAAAVDAFAAVNVDTAVDEVVRHIHVSLKKTRGAAVAVAAIDTHEQTLSYCGLGNISGALISSSERKHLLSDNGTAGFEARKIRAWKFSWPKHGLLVMYSDGISSRCLQSKYEPLWKHCAATIAGTLYRDHSKSIDDATVAALREGTDYCG